MIKLLDKKSLEILSEAVTFCNSIALYGFIYNEENEDESIELYNFQTQNLELEINFNSRIRFCRCEDYEEDACSEITIQEFIDLYSNINSYEIDKNYNVYGENIALFLVEEIDNYTTAKLLKDPIDNWCYTKVKINSDEYNVEFTSKRQVIFDILLLKEKNYDTDLPFGEQDYFIKVSSSSKLDMKIAEELAEAMIFELATNHKICLTHTTRWEKFDVYSIEVEKNTNFKMFPLLTGNGMADVIKLYNQSLNIDNFDYKILSLTKIIEYISPTLIKEKLNDRILQKLSEPKVLNPNAEYVSELQKIFEEYNKYKDSEMIKLAILEIVDIDEIEKILPAFLRKFQSNHKENNKEMLSKLSQAISDTRNNIAHAKANYNDKGLECPNSEKEEFIQILLIISRQFIRWFYNQSPNKRVLKA